MASKTPRQLWDYAAKLAASVQPPPPRPYRVPPRLAALADDAARHVLERGGYDVEELSVVHGIDRKAVSASLSRLRRKGLFEGHALRRKTAPIVTPEADENHPFVADNLPLVDYVLRPYPKLSPALRDAARKAALAGLVHAARRFDPKRTTRDGNPIQFGTYAVASMIGCVKTALRRASQKPAPPSGNPVRKTDAAPPAFDAQARRLVSGLQNLHRGGILSERAVMAYLLTHHGVPLRQTGLIIGGKKQNVQFHVRRAGKMLESVQAPHSN